MFSVMLTLFIYYLFISLIIYHRTFLSQITYSLNVEVAILLQDSDYKRL